MGEPVLVRWDGGWLSAELSEGRSRLEAMLGGGGNVFKSLRLVSSSMFDLLHLEL